MKKPKRVKFKKRRIEYIPPEGDEEEEVEEEEDLEDDFEVEEEEDELEDELKRSPVAAPSCYGSLFYNPDRSECDALYCVLRTYCRQKCDESGQCQAFRSRIVKGNKSTLNGTQLGVRLFRELQSELVDRFWIRAASKRFFNVVLKGEEDKHRQRYLRVWPHSRGMRLDVCPSLAAALDNADYIVKYFREDRAKCFRPHIGSVTIKSSYTLRRFLRMFNDWAGEREYKPINEEPRRIDLD